ncbi:hypothetical protein LY78DRAFT_373273 [Colletotrichum sublineola]|nr:hypothetical protein LY78DRAFT_373273 [Colletotrichum sublineola]
MIQIQRGFSSPSYHFKDRPRRCKMTITKKPSTFSPSREPESDIRSDPVQSNTMTTTYFNSVTSKSAYEKRRRDAESTLSSSSSSFTHSLQSLARDSTSNWSTRQLTACRVYVTTHKDINTLHIFPDRKPPLDLTQIPRKRDHAGRPKATNSACTAASDSDSCWERVLFQLVKLCQGPQETTTLSEHRRLRNDDDSMSHI